MAKRTTAKKTRNGGTWTNAQFWGRVRSQLRRMSMYWIPIKQALEDAKRPYKGNNKRQKWEYKCAACKKWFIRKGVHVDHVIPAGSLRKAEDLAGFIERLFCEHSECYTVLCKKCHKIKTDEERNMGRTT